MPLCQICGRIDLLALTLQGQRRESDVSSTGQGYPADLDLYYYNAPKDDAFIPHHENLEELKASAATCELCRLIQTCVDETHGLYRIARRQGFRYDRSGHKLFLLARFGSDGFQIVSHKPGEGDRWDLMGGIGFCVDDESPLASVIQGRMVPLSPKCPVALRRIKNWIQTCRETHAHKFPGAPKLPTRVLEIMGGGSEVAVRLSGGALGDYVALSHCWGPVQPTTLNRDTATNLMAGVKTSTLPRSFQDAVWVAHELGLRWLWIDSLCILQDDAEDWARESGCMSDVYGHAYLTISASRAAGCTEGFLSDRKLPGYVSIPSQAGHSEDILAFVLPRKYAGDERRCVRLEEEPLSSRGWAWQERYLSQRTLHFGHRQTFFECQRTFQAEDFCSVSPQGVGMCQATITRPAEWIHVIQEYSRRRLTFPGDKLPAVAGLARRLLAKTTSDLDTGTDTDTDTATVPSDGKASTHVPSTGYLAGLRWDHIIDDLCWELDSYTPSGERPPTYRAPSWSWASIDGAISYYRCGLPRLANARDGHIDLDLTENPMGKVNGGWLSLHTLRLTAKMPKSDEHDRVLRFREDGVSVYTYPAWDSESEDSGNGEKPDLWVIPLTWNRDVANDSESRLIFGPFCLVVEAVEHQLPAFMHVPGFRRVGGCLMMTDQREELRQLLEKWTDKVEAGELEHILLF